MHPREIVLPPQQFGGLDQDSPPGDCPGSMIRFWNDHFDPGDWPLIAQIRPFVGTICFNFWFCKSQFVFAGVYLSSDVLKYIMKCLSRNQSKSKFIIFVPNGSGTIFIHNATWQSSVSIWSSQNGSSYLQYRLVCFRIIRPKFGMFGHIYKTGHA